LKGHKLPASKAFSYFLQNEISEDNFTLKTLKTFARLDDYDVLSAIKDWISYDDKILSKLAESVINRKLPKVLLQSTPITTNFKNEIKEKVNANLKLSPAQLNYFVYYGKVCNQAYNSEIDTIKILYKNGALKDIAKASDHFNIQTLANPVYKYYLCYPKK